MTLMQPIKPRCHVDEGRQTYTTEVMHLHQNGRGTSQSRTLQTPRASTRAEILLEDFADQIASMQLIVSLVQIDSDLPQQVSVQVSKCIRAPASPPNTSNHYPDTHTSSSNNLKHQRFLCPPQQESGQGLPSLRQDSEQRSCRWAPGQTYTRCGFQSYLQGQRDSASRLKTSL